MMCTLDLILGRLLALGCRCSREVLTLGRARARGAASSACLLVALMPAGERRILRKGCAALTVFVLKEWVVATHWIVTRG